MAARLYATAAVPTKKAACRAVGLSEGYLSILSMSGNSEVNQILDETDRALADKTISLSATIALLARKAADRMKDLIASSNEHVALKASSDILDRTPETSKTFKHSITSWSLDGDDAKELARALVESARVKERFSAVAAGDFVRVDLEADNGKEEAPRKQGLSGDRPSVEVKAFGANGEPERGLSPSEGGEDEG
jgi:hypothetical protein